jgi:hypothetical protein
VRGEQFFPQAYLCYAAIKSIPLIQAVSVVSKTALKTLKFDILGLQGRWYDNWGATGAPLAGAVKG